MLFRQTTITTININHCYGVYKYALYMQISNVYIKYIVNNLNLHVVNENCNIRMIFFITKQIKRNLA
jgi:hypothetical protein